MWPAASPTALATATTVAVFLTVVVGKFGRISSTPVQHPGTQPNILLFLAISMISKKFVLGFYERSLWEISVFKTSVEKLDQKMIKFGSPPQMV